MREDAEADIDAGHGGGDEEAGRLALQEARLRFAEGGQFAEGFVEHGRSPGFWVRSAIHDAAREDRSRCGRSGRGGMKWSARCAHGTRTLAEVDVAVGEASLSEAQERAGSSLTRTFGEQRCQCGTALPCRLCTQRLTTLKIILCASPA